MPKVIHKSKKCEAISSASQQNLNLELHRGLEGNTSDPYLYRSNPKEKARKLLWTLVSVISHPRCSSTFIRNQRNLRLFGAVSSIALILIISLTLVPVSTKTDTADATTGTATESSTTITVNQATASVDLTAASADGTFATSTGAGIASFGVKTTNYTGYTLTVKASDNDGTLNNTSGTGSFTSISSVLDEKTFDTSTYNGKWGYKPSKYNSIENVAYWPSPTTTATTLDVTKVANSTDNTYTIALGARAAYTQPTGTYSKTVTLTATANQAAYEITYADNTGDTITNLPDKTIGGTTSTTIPLSTVTPSRTGFVFDGWCSVAPTVDSTTHTATCPSGKTKYTAGGTYGIDQTTANNTTLYATWTVPTYTITIKPSTGVASVSLDGVSCSSTSGCPVSNLTYGQSYTLTATMSDGYDFAAWSPQGAGSVANITSASTNFTIGEGTATITAVASGAAAQAVKVNFAAAGNGTVGISSVTFKETATGNTVGTVSASGNTVKLEPGVGYTVTANTSGIYGVSIYNNGTDPFALNNANYGTLAPTTNNVTYFTPNSSSASAIITVTSCVKNITGTMQTYSTPLGQLCDDATGSLTDSRDNQAYTVGKVTANNGGRTALWMTQNLRYLGDTGSTSGSMIMKSATSNISADKTLTYGDLTSGDSYTEARIHDSGNATTGVWYNYAAASAGAITGNDNTDEQTYGVCPKGWRLPYISEISAAASNKDSFKPVAGGNYGGGTLEYTGSGLWWSNNTTSATTKWTLIYSNSYTFGGYRSRAVGFYVRCVRS